jgi:hypothetical protein
MFWFQYLPVDTWSQVSELGDSLVTTFLEMAHANWNVFLALAENRHFSHSDAGRIISSD